MKNIKFSTVSTVEATEVTPKTLSWTALTKLLFKSKFQESGRDGSGLVPSKIKEGEGQTEATRGKIGRFRQSHLVEYISLLVLDIEETEISDDHERIMEWIENRLPEETLYAVYTTYHHGVEQCDRCCDEADKWEPDHPRLRLIVPLADPVAPEKYQLLFRWAEDTFDGVDTQTKDSTRISYLPRMPHPDAELDGFVDIEGDGEPLDVAELPLSEYERTVTTDTKTATHHATRRSLTVEQLAEALEHIDEVNKRDRWLTVGMALYDYQSKGHLPESDAYGLWVEWSKQSKKFDADDQQKTWNSFRPRSDGYSIGTIIHHATENGWSAPYCGSNRFKLGDDVEIADRLRRDWYEVEEVDHFDAVIMTGRRAGKQGKTAMNTGYPTMTFVHDSARLWTYDPEVGHFVEVDRSEVIDRVARYSGAPKGEKGTLRISHRKAKSVFNLCYDQAKYRHGHFFEDAPPTVKMKDCTIGWLEDKGVMVKIDGRRSPIEWRCNHEVDARFGDGIDLDVPEDSEFLRFLRTSMIGPGTYERHGFDASNMTDAAARIEALQKYTGLCLMGRGTDSQKAVFLVGPGGSGKTLFCELIESIFPNERVSHVPPSKMSHENRAVPLVDSAINIVTEVDQQELLRTGQIKQLISGDGIQVRRMYNDPEKAKPTCGHVLSCNPPLPAVSDRSSGFWRRWQMVSFPHRIQGTKYEDDDLKDRILKNERELIVKWALQGFLKWQKNPHLPNCDTNEDLLDEWKCESDSVTEFYYEFEIDESKPQKDWAKVTTAYKHYRAWCDNTGRNAVAQRKFSRRMERVAEKKEASKGTIVPVDVNDMLKIVS